MLKNLSLKQKVLFISLSIIWTGLFIEWVYQGYLWDQQQQMESDKDEGPEAYYP